MGFVPSRKQVELLNAMIDIEVPSTVTGICKHIGISRSTYYEWIKNKDFKKWFSKNHALSCAMSVAMLDKIAFSKAGEDFRYMELLQIKYGGYKRNGDVNTGDKPTDYTIEIIDKTEDVIDSK